MNDRISLLKLLQAIERARIAMDREVAEAELFELAASIREKLEAQETAEAESVAQYEEGPLAELQ